MAYSWIGVSAKTTRIRQFIFFLSLYFPSVTHLDTYPEGIKSCTAGRFREITGANFLDGRLIATAEGLYSNWMDDQLPIDQTSKKIIAKYLTPFLSKQSEKLMLTKREEIGYEVVAAEPIEAGSPLGEYTGEMVAGRMQNEKGRDTTYLFESTDGKRWRNLLSMCSDGLPNVHYFSVENKEGLPLRVMFFAIRTIAKGEVICWNYGATHKIKWGFYHISDQQSQKLEERWRECFNCKSPKSDIEQARAQVDLQYFTNTPEAQVRLALKGGDNHLLQIIKDHGRAALELSKFSTALMKDMISKARLLGENLQKLPPEQRDYLTDFSMRLVLRYERIFVSQVLEVINLHLPKLKELTIPLSLKEEKIIQDSAEESILEFCEYIRRGREKRIARGMKTYPLPVDLKAVVERLSKTHPQS